jgi:hypothetical protein
MNSEKGRREKLVVRSEKLAGSSGRPEDTFSLLTTNY